MIPRKMNSFISVYIGENGLWRETYLHNSYNSYKSYLSYKMYVCRSCRSVLEIDRDGGKTFFLVGFLLLVIMLPVFEWIGWLGGGLGLGWVDELET